MAQGSVTQFLKSAGLIDFSRVYPPLLNRATDFGTAVHLMTELWDRGRLDIKSLDKALIPYLNGWKQFLKDYGIEINPDEIEKRFVSKRYRFHGRPDRWPVIKGKRTLIDIKSSTQMYAATEIQTAGYQILLEENGIKVKQRWGVQLREDGTYNIEVYKEASDRLVFLACLSIHNYKLRRGLIK